MNLAQSSSACESRVFAGEFPCLNWLINTKKYFKSIFTFVVFVFTTELKQPALGILARLNLDICGVRRIPLVLLVND